MRGSLVLLAAALAACSGGDSTKSQRESVRQPPVPAAPPRNVAAAADVAPDAAPEVAPAAKAANASDASSPDLFVERAMMAPDGTAVLLEIVNSDDARGLPNLAYELRDRRDHTTTRFVIQKLEEEITDEVATERMTAVREIVKARGLVPLAELFSGDPLAEPFASGDLMAALANGTLVFKQRDQVLVKRKLPRRWQYANYFNKLEGITCKNPPFLRAAFVAPAAKLAVVEIAYEGTDSCWAPSPQLHVLTW